MPVPFTFSDTLYEKLQRLAVPFVDTPESVITALVDAELDRRARSSSAQPQATASKSRNLDPDRHPSLTHSRLLSARVDGKPLHRPKWNTLMDFMHVLARKNLGSFEAVQRVTSARVQAGRYEENGFQYLPDADLSIQGVDANLAWDHSLRLARHLKVSLEAELEWRVKDGAAHPGETAVLCWVPPSLAIA